MVEGTCPKCGSDLRIAIGEAIYPARGNPQLECTDEDCDYLFYLEGREAKQSIGNRT